MVLESCESILNDPARLKALEDSGLMEPTSVEAFQRLNTLATLALKAPVSIFSVIGKDRQIFKSVAGLPPEICPGTSFPLDVSVCVYALQGNVLQLEDTKNHPAFILNEPVQNLNISGYLGIPLIDKSGHALGTVCVFDREKRIWSNEEVEILKEITNSFLTEIELRKALKEAQEEVRCREDFMSIASHELKTPLTSLKLAAHLARRKHEKNPSDAVQYLGLLDKFERQFNRLQLVIDDMFDISRLNSGNFSLNLKEVHLSDLVEKVLQRLSPMFAEASCAINLHSFGNFIGHWDPYRLEQVLENLLNNAVKYAPGKPITVEVVSKNEEILISIIDHGPGLREDFLELAFNPFKRMGDDSNIPGLGLGLYISKEIMKAHGGDIKLKSVQGIGSTFIMVLPE